MSKTADSLRFDRNFIGEKIIRRVTMLPGVHVETSKNQKDELQLTGNSLQNVSQSAADIQQVCMVRNKDIRKVSFPYNSRFYMYHRIADLGLGLVLGRSLCVGTRQHSRRVELVETRPRRRALLYHRRSTTALQSSEFQFPS